MLPRVDLKKRDVDVKAWWRKIAPDSSHYSTLLDTSSLLFVDGEPAGFYVTLPEDEVFQIRQACQAIEYQSTYRTVGLRTCSRVIGFQPRLALRRDYCTSVALERESPESHSALCAGAALVAKYLQGYFPEQHAAQARIVQERVKPEWVLPGSHFTSGIVNWNSQLRYHFDAGNFPGTWNAMLTFKKDIDGGYLAIP